MIYSLEYLNEDAQVELLRFDTTTQTYEIVLSGGVGGQYTEPTNSLVYICYDVKSDKPMVGTPDGLTRQWAQKIGQFVPYWKEKGADDMKVHAYEFINSIVKEDKVIEFMNQMLDGMKKNGVLNEAGVVAENDRSSGNFKMDVQ